MFYKKFFQKATLLRKQTSNSSPRIRYILAGFCISICAIGFHQKDKMRMKLHSINMRKHFPDEQSNRVLNGNNKGKVCTLCPHDPIEIQHMLKLVQKYRLKLFLHQQMQILDHIKAYASLDISNINYFSLQSNGTLDVGIGLKVETLKKKLAEQGLFIPLLQIDFNQLRVIDLLNMNWGLSGSWTDYLQQMKVASSRQKYFEIDRFDGAKTVGFNDFLGKEGYHGIITHVLLRPVRRDSTTPNSYKAQQDFAVMRTSPLQIQDILKDLSKKSTLKHIRLNDDILLIEGQEKQLTSLLNCLSTDGVKVLYCSNALTAKHVREQSRLLQGVQCKLRARLRLIFDEGEIFYAGSMQEQLQQKHLHNFYRKISFLM